MVKTKHINSSIFKKKHPANGLGVFIFS